MKKLILLILIISCVYLPKAQDTLMMNGTQTVVSGCDFMIYDSGGPSGDYGSGRKDSLTIYSNDSTHASVHIQILALNVHPSDTFYIFNGSSTRAPLLVKFNNFNFTGNGIYNYTATIQNPTGALTILLVSDSVNAGGGFVLTASCEKTCQRIAVDFDQIHSSHIPKPDTTLNDGYLYLDLCPNEVVTLEAHGFYADNDYSYHQGDLLNTFTWHFSDTTFSGTGLASIANCFRNGIGYEASVTIQDTMGCGTQVPYTFRIRTSSNPIAVVNPIPDICVGSDAMATVSYTSASPVQVNPVGSGWGSTLGITETVFLPDGEYCPPYGYSYRSPVTFNSFAATDTISSQDDILYVLLNIEHSWVGDILITLFCPNGNSAIIVPDYQTYHWAGVTRAFFGMAIDLDDNTCDPTTANNVPGVGWNYCWSNSVNQGYSYSAGSGYVYESNNIGHDYYNVIDSTHVSQMTQVYHPYESFGNLVGCPLNGTWYIEVVDTWSVDNGYIFGWEMALDPSLLPQNWTYNVLIDSVIWTGNNISSTSTTSALIQGIGAGNHTYGFTIVDEYGCRYDSTFSVQVHLPDTTSIYAEICRGETYFMNGFHLAEAGNDTLYRKNVYGCDSLVTLSLSVNEPYFSRIDAEICQGDTYSQNGFTRSVAGTDTLFLQTVKGCDSIIVLSLTVNDTVTTSLQAEICFGEIYSQNGFNVSSPGTHQLSLLTSHGCDSIVTLSLVVNMPSDTYFAATICFGESYTQNGFDVSEAGNYVQHLQNEKGCDSTVHLSLVISSQISVNLGEDQLLCNNDVESLYLYAGNSNNTYRWNTGDTTNAIVITESGYYSVTVTNALGCSGTDYIQINFMDNPTVEITQEIMDSCLNFLAILTAVTDAYSLVWNTGETGNSIEVSDFGVYSVIASNFYCNSYDTLEIEFYCPQGCNFPNVLTPSLQDGINDYFFLPPDNPYDDLEIYIYNRWGKLIFYSSEKDFKWDGTENGSVICGVYYYVIHFGEKCEFHGTITVL